MANFGDFYRGKRVLVTGHTGFKGAWLSEWLLALGAEVAGFSDQIPTQPSLFEVLGLGKRLRDFRGDVRDLGALGRSFAEFRPEVVFHLAAQPLVRLSYEDPVGTIATNVVGTANLLECVRKSPSVGLVVNITSDKCYENREWAYSYRENDPMGGYDPYSASKGCAELIFSSFARSFFASLGQGPVVVTARAGNVIGGGDWARDRIVVDCVKAWGAGKPVILRNPHATRPWQHVLDCLSGYLTLGARARTEPARLNGEGFNFGPAHGHGATVMELVSELAANWRGAQWEVAADLSGQPHEAKFLRLNCDKAAQVLGWRPRWDMHRAAQATSEWYELFYRAGASASLLELTRSQIRAFQ
ncbi:MAG: CDP-glucose 4,6-dehydratase [Oligoflexia bacterium]